MNSKIKFDLWLTKDPRTRSIAYEGFMCTNMKKIKK